MLDELNESHFMQAHLVSVCKRRENIKQHGSV